MKANRIAAAAFGCAALAQAAGAWAATMPAFPGAEGYGADAVGGRGGDVYHVTTLADDPNHVIRGSLFYGLYEKDVTFGGQIGRTIVFDVGGTINLGSTALDLKNIKNVTVAGQTAPSPITITGNTVQITSSGGKETGNIILQNITIRKGLANGEDALSIKGSGNTHDIMVDHVSGSWSEDEVISVAGATNHADKVTVQNSIMSEALTSGHQYGALIRNDQSARVSYNHNLFSNNASRNPRPGTYKGTQLDFEFQNNVIYNWSDRAGYTGGASENDTENVNMNYVGNYAIAGPSTPAGSKRTTAFTRDASDDPINLHVYQSGNKIDSNTNALRDGTDTGWGMFANWDGTTTSAFPAAGQMATSFPYPAANAADSADVAYSKVVGGVGAFAWARSTTDQRLINELKNYGGVAAQSSPNSSEWTALSTAGMTTRAAGYDQELRGNYSANSWEGTQMNPQAKPLGDGMPTWWENLRGYNPLALDNNIVTSDNYTRLEHYLHYASMIANWDSTIANGNWSEHWNWRGTRPERIDSSANFGSGNGPSGSFIILDIPATVSHMNFSSGNSYAISGGSTLNLRVIDGSSEVNVTAGSHGISAPVTLSNNLLLTAAPGTGLTMSNLQPSTVTLTKAGGGGFAVNNVRATGLNITGGSVVILPDGTAAGVSKIADLAIAAGAKLDLTNNHLVTGAAVGSYSGSVYTGVTGMIQSGRGTSGTWNGSTGIVTSQTEATTGTLTSIGIARASDLGISTTGVWAGQTVASTDTLVMYTYAGDANLDGKINIDDYTRIDQGIVAAAGGWSNGDFNYDGKINIDDYVIIDANIASQGPALFAAGGESGLSNGVSAIPEPGGLGLGGAVVAIFAGRSRRMRGK